MEPAEGAAGGGDDGAGGAGGGSHRRPTLAPRIKRMMQVGAHVERVRVALTPAADGDMRALLRPGRRRRGQDCGPHAPGCGCVRRERAYSATCAPLIALSHPCMPPGKAMELFLGTVVTKACAAAKKRGAKLLSTGHL